MPHSRLREAICRVLMAEGFLAGVEVGGEVLQEDARAQAALLADARVRHPRHRARQQAEQSPLCGAGEIGKVRGAMGVQIVSTPLGVMTGREARRRKVGGEIL